MATMQLSIPEAPGTISLALANINSYRITSDSAERKAGQRLSKRIKHLAPDVAAETIMDLLENEKNFKDNKGNILSSIVSLSHTIATRKAINLNKNKYNKAARFTELEQQGPEGPIAFDIAIKENTGPRIPSPLEEAILSVVGKLPPKIQQALELRHQDDMKVEEIAKKLELTPKYASKLINQGYQTIRGALLSTHQDLLPKRVLKSYGTLTSQPAQPA